MKRLLFAVTLSFLMHTSVQAQLQKQIQIPKSPDLSQLEGVTLKIKNSSVLVITNASIEKRSDSSAAKPQAQAGALSSPQISTVIKTIGPYEIRRQGLKSPSGVAEVRSMSSSGSGSLPKFAESGSGREFIGAAYLYNSKQIGLISNEVVAKFKSGSVPQEYASYKPIELVSGSGLYVFVVGDIYAWLALVSKLQSDPQVSMVEPQIKKDFEKLS
jgi:hypothetical protein